MKRRAFLKSDLYLVIATSSERVFSTIRMNCNIFYQHRKSLPTHLMSFSAGGLLAVVIILPKSWPKRLANILEQTICHPATGTGSAPVFLLIKEFKVRETCTP